MNKPQFLTTPAGISADFLSVPRFDLQPLDNSTVRDRHVVPIPLTESSEPTAHQNMLLTNEAGLALAAPSWALVEQTIQELDSGRENSFCVLELPYNTYVQCLHGFNGWHLEWRLSGSSLDSYIHLRAAYREGWKKPFELKKSDHVSPGEHRDLLAFEDVLDAFRAFHQGRGPTKSLEWREFDV